MSSTITIKAEDIKAGDEFVGSPPDDVSPYVFWTAVRDAEVGPDPTADPTAHSVPVVVIVQVRHHDGGLDYRGWEPGDEIEVRRRTACRNRLPNRNVYCDRPGGHEGNHRWEWIEWGAA